jgi:hypothetical protein
MAKLTTQDIEKTKVIRATFEDSKWVILVSDENNYIYRVEFEGSESDDNETLLSKTHIELLEIEKYEPVVIPEPIVREDLNGLNPGK